MYRLWLIFICSFSCAVTATTPLRVVTELSPPHQTQVNGEVAGLSTALVRATLAQAGITAQIELYPWARAFRIAKSQPGVLIYNMARTAERETQFHWIGTVAAYQLGFVALSHREDIRINALSDASGYTIAVQRDDLSANFLMKNGFSTDVQLVLAADITESWQLLLHGKVDLIIDDATALNAMALALGVPEKYLRFVYPIPQLAQHTWLAASLNTSDELIKRLQQAHSKVAATEQYKQVMSSTYQLE